MKNKFSSLALGALVFLTSLQATAAVSEKFVARESSFPTADVAKGLRIGIIRANWNTDIVDSLFLDCLEELLAHGIQSNNITVVTVPGSLELSFGAEKLFIAEACDLCICLGAIIEGSHALWVESLAHAVVKNISEVSFLFAKPVICGVVICTQAEADALIDQHIGAAWARSALMMSSL